MDIPSEEWDSALAEYTEIVGDQAAEMMIKWLAVKENKEDMERRAEENVGILTDPKTDDAAWETAIAECEEIIGPETADLCRGYRLAFGQSRDQRLTKKDNGWWQALCRSTPSCCFPQ